MIHRVVIIFLLTSLNVHAALCQSPYVDSLENLVKSKIPDTVKVWALNELSREFIFGSPKESFRLANEALTLAQRIGYKRGEAYSYRVLASMSGAHDQYLPYSEYLQKGIKLFIELKDSVGLANCFITEAVVYNRQLNFEESIKSYKKAISIFRSANLEDRIAVCLSNMGFVFFRMENYPNAKESLVEAIAMKDAIDNTPTLMNAYNNLGLVELKLANIPSAEDYFEKVLSLNEALKDNSNSETYVETLIGLSDIYKLKGNPAQQEKYLGLARENAEQFQNLELMKEVYLRLAGYYLHKQNYEMARESFQNLSVTDDSIT
ncbi:MAG: tetratricopeptide repeat protein, partial [Cyclobacteriaceae bacterium]